jgi:uncharacterized protein YbaA (DUF1428 family)
MSYVDGFVVPVPTKNLADYKKMASLGRKLWMKHGALHYFECVGNDLDVGYGLPFPKGIRARAGETIVFSFIIFKSKAHRDAVNKKVMSDPAMATTPKKMPFDMKRMMYGGFKTIVEG